MDKIDKEVPKDGYGAYIEGFDLEDNPFCDFEQEYEDWDKGFLEAAKRKENEVCPKCGSSLGHYPNCPDGICFIKDIK